MAVDVRAWLRVVLEWVMLWVCQAGWLRASSKLRSAKTTLPRETTSARPAMRTAVSSTGTGWALGVATTAYDGGFPRLLGG